MLIGWVKGGLLVAGAMMGFVTSSAHGSLPLSQQTSEQRDVADRQFNPVRPAFTSLSDQQPFRRTNSEVELLKRIFYPPSQFWSNGDIQ